MPLVLYVVEHNVIAHGLSPSGEKQLHQLLRVDMLVASTPRISVVKFTVAWSEHILKTHSTFP